MVSYIQKVRHNYTTLEEHCNRYGEELRKDGWRMFSEEEDYLAQRIGKRNLLAICESSFRYVDLEYHYLFTTLKIELNSKEEGKLIYKKMQDTNRAMAIHCTAEMLLAHDKEVGNVNDEFHFNPLSDEEMLLEIKSKYHRYSK